MVRNRIIPRVITPKPITASSSSLRMLDFLSYEIDSARNNPPGCIAAIWLHIVEIITSNRKNVKTGSVIYNDHNHFSRLIVPGTIHQDVSNLYGFTSLIM